MKLARKLVLLLLVPFLLLTVVLGVLAARREAEVYRGQVADDLRITGDALRATLSEVWRNEGQARALEVLARSDERLPDVKIRWVALDIGHPIEDQRLGPREVASLAGGNQVVLVEGVSGHGQAFVFMPVQVDGTTLGAIELSEPMHRESELIRLVVRDRLLTTAGVVLLCTFVVGVIGRRYIARPVQSLVEQARRVGLGDLSQRLTLAQKDELGELAVEMNAMCDQVAEARAKASTETHARLEALTQLRHAERLATIGKMAAGVAHELGTPLNVISGRARMIARGKGAPETAVVENATIIDGQAQRMTAIIRQLLTFARGGRPMKARVVLPEVARTTLDMLRPLAKRQSVDLRLHCANEEANLDADAGQLQQVLTNLVMNGIQAMPHGGEIIVSIRDVAVTPPAEHGGPTGSYVCLEVRDQGTGISTGDLSRVFEPFFTTRDVGDGTGLGLSVTHGIVRDHGGWIVVETEMMKGSRFSVFLPHEVTT